MNDYCGLTIEGSLRQQGDTMINGMKKNKEVMHSAEPLLRELRITCDKEVSLLPIIEEAASDINFIYRLYDLQKIVRYYNQTYWEEESFEDALTQGKLYLENVAAHSFQVASAAQIIAPHFPFLNRLKALELALVHDQPELLIGDKDPVGSDGQGLETHAFNLLKQREKKTLESYASRILSSKMRTSMRSIYNDLFVEIIDGLSSEARFIKALDKLQALIFVRLKKKGKISDRHMAFTIRYAYSGLVHFPMLENHFEVVLSDILHDIQIECPAHFSSFCDSVAKHLLSMRHVQKFDLSEKHKA